MDFTSLMQQGSGHAWLYIPVAVLLGALHGLEPGHSKTMMAAFIIAIRGTVVQAVLLGLSAAISHSLVIWALAALALKFGSQWNAETAEPYFQLFSAFFIIVMAAWMFCRTRRDAMAEAAHHHHHHGHGHHHHGHDHHQGHHQGYHQGHHQGHGKTINTGHGIVSLDILEVDRPPVFQLSFTDHGKPVTPDPGTVSLATVRADGSRQTFTLVRKDGALESCEEIPEPHEFDVELSISHGDHSHNYRTAFHEDADGHHHDHDGHEDEEYQDAHEAAHAEDIRRRFADRKVTTLQIVLFGLTGGLMPCPAAFTVLIVCLQVKEYTLGFALVAAFSLGLALIMVTVGAVAALGVRHAEKRMKGFGKIMRRAPYFSCVLLVVLAAYMAWHGWSGLIR